MKVACRVVLVVVVVLVVMRMRPADAADGSVAHGKYIVESVAMCGRCHSPRVAQSEAARPLLGGPVPIVPVTPTENWAETARGWRERRPAPTNKSSDF